MNIEEFFRQANYIRDYSPGLVGGTGVIIPTITASHCSYLVLGKIVVALIDMNFTTAGVAEPSLLLDLPLTADISKGTGIFSGVGVNNALVGLAGFVASATQAFIAQTDASPPTNWAVGGGGKGLSGILIYRKTDTA